MRSISCSHLSLVDDEIFVDEAKVVLESNAGVQDVNPGGDGHRTTIVTSNTRSGC